MKYYVIISHYIASYQEDKPIHLYAVVLDHFKAVFFRQNLQTEWNQKRNDWL